MAHSHKNIAEHHAKLAKHHEAQAKGGEETKIAKYMKEEAKEPAHKHSLGKKHEKK